MKCALSSVFAYYCSLRSKYLSLGMSVLCNRTAFAIGGFNSRTTLISFPVYGTKQGFESLVLGLVNDFTSAVVY